MECGAEIIDPICPFCLASEIEYWLKEREEGEYADGEDIDGEGVIAKVREKVDDLLEHNTGSGECIVCNHNSVYLCPHCFHEAIYDSLKSASNETKLEFLRIFNSSPRCDYCSEEKLKLEETE